MTSTKDKKSKAGALSKETIAAYLAPLFRRQLMGWAGPAAFVALVLLLTTFPQPERDSLLEHLDKEIVASERVQAAFSYETEDLALTEERRKAEEIKQPHVYTVRDAVIESQVEKLAVQIDAVRGHHDAVSTRVFEALRDSTAEESAAAVAQRAVAQYVADLEDEPVLTETGLDSRSLAVWLLPAPDSLPERRFGEPADEETPAPVIELVPDDPEALEFEFANLLSTLTRENLEVVLAQGVRAADLHPALQERRISVLGGDGAASANAEIALADVPDPTRAAEALRARIDGAAKQWASVEGEPEVDWGKLSDAAMDLVRPFITDTLALDRSATEQARMQARKRVEPIAKEIQARETIIDEGERWDSQARSDARTYLELMQGNTKPERRFLARLVAHMILVALVLACLWRGLDIFGPKTARMRTNYLNLALLLLVSLLAVGRIARYIEPTGLAVPVAAVAILYAILVNVRLATMFSLLAAGLISVQYGYDWRLGAVSITMALAGVFSIYKVRKRSDMTAASLKATGAGLLAMVAAILALDGLFAEIATGRFVLITETAGRQLALIGLNGGVCIFLVPGLLPPLERMFGITTDIQLLEYSDLNNEVLGRFAMEVPASWSHSLMMGQLAEKVAEAIGANGLLTRVCAYYHDIGKIRKPEYFSENQTGVNVHDKLPPRMSARAISTHVTYGVQLARKYHLPQPIINGILEHHGTLPIGFFYQQARQQKKHDDVREESFRYPGPRPQSRETAILMICDAVESGVRSIKNPNKERVRDLVKKIIKARADDRQFDECDLTLKDLDTIADLLTEGVAGALHTRIAYPNMDKGEEQANIVPLSGGDVSGGGGL
ncbi:MAG: HD family phosphohydrolase [Candidatus Hydrogenedentota bacterium]